MSPRMTLLAFVLLPAWVSATVPDAGDRPVAFGDSASASVPLMRLADRKWEELSREERERIREARERFRKLPRDKQERLRRQWEDLPDKEKKRYRLERDKRRHERETR